MSKPVEELCAYCGVRPGATREHVVAKCFFVTVPNPPIVVSACAECNSGKGDGGDKKLEMDEVYARQAFCLSDKVANHPVMGEMAKKVMAKFELSKGLERLFIQSSRLIDVHTKEGVILPNQVAVEVDWKRIERVIRKITKGLLYAKFTQRPLPPEYEVLAMVNLPEDYASSLVGRMLKTPTTSGIITVGKDKVFIFTGAYHEQDMFRSVWVMTFYERYIAMGITQLKDEVRKAKEKHEAEKPKIIMPDSGPKIRIV